MLFVATVRKWLGSPAIREDLDRNLPKGTDGLRVGTVKGIGILRGELGTHRKHCTALANESSHAERNSKRSVIDFRSDAEEKSVTSRVTDYQRETARLSR